MNERIRIEPSGPLNAAIRPPGSKSITNRALICAALADGRSELRGLLDSEDTQVMVAALQHLGLEVDHDASQNCARIVGGAGEIPVQDADLFVANSGTTIRFLTAVLATANGRFRLDGVARMRQRPVGDLLEALRALGADVRAESQGGCPPISLLAHRLKGGRASIRGNISSQFLSGILLAAPNCANEVQVDVAGPLVSKPYIQMTLDVMRAFGVEVECDELQRFRIPPQTYQARSFDVEPDASAASYFWAAAAVAGGEVTVEGLHRESLQGDVAFCDCLEQMGCEVRYAADSITVKGGPLQGVDVDMNAISDTAQSLAATALFAKGPTTIRNVAHVRHKETDRIADLARELRKFGAEVEEFDDGMTITPGALRGAVIETYHDHRMAMSLALVGLKVPDVIILDPKCTEKTYPHFFTDLQRVAASGRTND